MWRVRLAKIAEEKEISVDHEKIISVSKMSALIEEWIHKERDRAIMKRRFCDGIIIIIIIIIYAQIAEEFDMSERQIKRICYENFEKLINHM